MHFVLTHKVLTLKGIFAYLRNTERATEEEERRERDQLKTDPVDVCLHFLIPDSFFFFKLISSDVHRENDPAS